MDSDNIFKKYEMGKFYEIRNVLWENYTGHIFGNSIDGFETRLFPEQLNMGLITSSDVGKNLYRSIRSGYRMACRTYTQMESNLKQHSSKSNITWIQIYIIL